MRHQVFQLRRRHQGPIKHRALTAISKLLVQFRQEVLYRKVNQDVVDADKLLAEGKYADAEDLYHKALNANSKDISARVDYGLSLTKRFKLERGQEELETALRKDSIHITRLPTAAKHSQRFTKFNPHH